MPTLITSDEVRAGDRITVPHLFDRPMLVEHVWTDEADPKSQHPLDTINITIWTTPPSDRIMPRDYDWYQFQPMITLGLTRGYPVIRFIDDDNALLARGRAVFGLVDSVRYGRTSVAGHSSRIVRLTDGREVTTAIDSSASYDAANLHGGDPVWMVIERGRAAYVRSFSRA